MNRTVESKTVREARASARKIARKGQHSYQQALDRVAREVGAEHWAAFVAMHPAAPVADSPEAAPDVETVRQEPARRSGLRPLVRAIASGEMAERAIADAESDTAQEARNGFSPEFRAMTFVAFVTVVLNGFHAPLLTLLTPAMGALALVHSLRRIARLVGDHPSVAMRRRQLRDAATMGIILCLAFSIGAGWPDALALAAQATGLAQDQVVPAGLVGAAIMYAIRRHGLAVMLVEAPATIPRFERSSPVSGYVAPGWFARTLQIALVAGASACLVGLVVMFLTSVAVLLHVASWPTLYHMGGVAAAVGYLISGGAHWIDSRLRRSGYLEGPTIMSRLSPI